MSKAKVSFDIASTTVRCCVENATPTTAKSILCHIDASIKYHNAVKDTRLTRDAPGLHIEVNDPDKTTEICKRISEIVRHRYQITDSALTSRSLVS